MSDPRTLLENRLDKLRAELQRTAAAAAPSNSASAKDWPRRDTAGVGASLINTAKPALASASAPWPSGCYRPCCCSRPWR